MNSDFRAGRLALVVAVGLASVAPESAMALAQKDDAAALARYKKAEAIAKAQDFDVFSNQRWDRLKESHSQNIVVHWPDGHTTTGIDRHISVLKALFVYAPDTRIKQHPVRLGEGEWTAVTGVMEGTFTKPMPSANGPIPPNGKSFKLPMATVGHWKNSTMDEEYLFWDNATYMSQLGAGK